LRLRAAKQLGARAWVSSGAGGHSLPVEEVMLTAGTRALAFARFGFDIAHGGGEALGLLVMMVTAVGILVWALSHSGHSQSAKYRADWD
jgi:hypothetical protein